MRIVNRSIEPVWVTPRHGTQRRSHFGRRVRRGEQSVASRKPLGDCDSSQVGNRSGALLPRLLSTNPSQLMVGRSGLDTS